MNEAAGIRNIHFCFLFFLSQAIKYLDRVYNKIRPDEPISFIDVMIFIPFHLIMKYQLSGYLYTQPQQSTWWWWWGTVTNRSRWQSDMETNDLAWILNVSFLLSLCECVCCCLEDIFLLVLLPFLLILLAEKYSRRKGASSVVTLERSGNRCELYLWLDILFSLLRIASFIQIHQHEIDGYLIKAWLVNQMRWTTI